MQILLQKKKKKQEKKRGTYTQTEKPIKNFNDILSKKHTFSSHCI